MMVAALVRVAAPVTSARAAWLQRAQDHQQAKQPESSPKRLQLGAVLRWAIRLKRCHDADRQGTGAPVSFANASVQGCLIGTDAPILDLPSLK